MGAAFALLACRRFQGRHLLHEMIGSITGERPSRPENDHQRPDPDVPPCCALAEVLRPVSTRVERRPNRWTYRARVGGGGTAGRNDVPHRVLEQGPPEGGLSSRGDGLGTPMVRRVRACGDCFSRRPPPSRHLRARGAFDLSAPCRLSHPSPGGSRSGRTGSSLGVRQVRNGTAVHRSSPQRVGLLEAVQRTMPHESGRVGRRRRHVLRCVRLHRRDR